MEPIALMAYVRVHTQDTVGSAAGALDETIGVTVEFVGIIPVSHTIRGFESRLVRVLSEE